MCLQSKAIDQVHVDFLLTLVLKYSPLSCLQMAHQALRYLASLPDNKSGEAFLVEQSPIMPNPLLPGLAARQQEW